MIVLDEQLLGRNLELEIAKWYRGKILFITDLRPHTVIKDDAIPGLLRQQSQPTFVTINWKNHPDTFPQWNDEPQPPLSRSRFQRTSALLQAFRR